MKRSGFKTRSKPLQAKQVRQRIRRRMKARSGKPKARKSATGPLVDIAYANAVREMDCCACGAPGPSDIHHCKDKPPADEKVYVYCPGYGERSADRDGIPLCRFGCHALYHRDPAKFHDLYGCDYQYIPTTRAAVYFMEIGF